MLKYENDCVDCPQGCIQCGRNHTPHLYCDECGEDAEVLYDYDGEELCQECLLEHFNKITL